MVSGICIRQTKDSFLQRIFVDSKETNQTLGPGHFTAQHSSGMSIAEVVRCNSLLYSTPCKQFPPLREMHYLLEMINNLIRL